jgi:Helix-turn-helix.
LQNPGVPKAPQPKLEEKLANFLKSARGQTSYAEFSKKTGLTPSTLFRLENRQQSITLGRLEQVMVRLKVTLVDIFGQGNP